MEHTEKTAQHHLTAAKDELKSAAAVIVNETKAEVHGKIEQAKNKVNEVIENVTGAVSNKSDEVHAETKKATSAS